MQYLLTKQEYDELVARGIEKTQSDTKILQDLCSKVADYMPTQKPWNWKEGDPLQPYRCVLTSNNEYCDDCPVRNACPNQYKYWSK
jgi:hypothetical protein